MYVMHQIRDKIPYCLKRRLRARMKKAVLGTAFLEALVELA